ncbi:MAG: bifunctional phosphoribosylaminoimidazolecarboxamide formyltransferase/IMP cyclohydrolase PurH [Flavobacteriales bacterium]|nr:bifunctional phosphoribosylaminoimidazolecarboxamide formyltransferase/IMP cyclohydrolase PurH [Flavobacteriales bacterium]
MKKVQNAFISVFKKDNLKPLIETLISFDVKLFSSGGTKLSIEELGGEVTSVEEITNYPSILGGRVKTLHPKIFGGILKRSNNKNDLKDLEKYNIPVFDLVIVDLYPFEETVKNNDSEQNIIEKIDIGGISLIRAGAKNFKDVMIVPCKKLIPKFIEIIKKRNGKTSIEDRIDFAKKAFEISSNYDQVIFSWFNNSKKDSLKINIFESKKLRYGENPHQEGVYYGDLNKVFKQLNGKEISYNNLLDIDSAINLIKDCKEPTFAILKHNNACGIAVDKSVLKAWEKALAGDPISAFGGVLITNQEIDYDVACSINKLFFEIILSPKYSSESLKILKSKKNRIILKINDLSLNNKNQYRSILTGILAQEKDILIDKEENLEKITKLKPSKSQIEDLLFASTICKHTKSNAIVLVKNKQLIGIGCGQTSRIDALKQAIEKAKKFEFDLKNSVMASDAFFPFPDCIEIAAKENISAVIQPGGSINDKLSIDSCNKNNISMVLTKTRHFKH